MSYWYGGSALAGAAIGGLTADEDHIGPGDLYPDWMKGTRQDLGANIMSLPDREAYQGDWIAGMNPNMQNSLDGMNQWGADGGMGNTMMNDMYGAGSNMMNVGTNQINRMNAEGPNQFQYDQGTYDQSFNNLSGGMQNQFDLGARNISRNFDWNQLPGLNMQNAMAGGQGSTKFGQSGALGQAMADQNVMQFGSDLWSNAANRADVNAMGAGSQNLASANNYDSKMMGLVGQGGNMMNNAYNMGTNNLGLANQAGQWEQNYDQSLANAERQKWDMQQNLPWQDQADRLQQMKQFEMGMMPQTTGTSTMEGMINGAGTGMGLYGMFAQGQAGAPGSDPGGAGAVWNPGGTGSGFSSTPGNQFMPDLDTTFITNPLQY